jgi:hypothetical protein
LFRDRRDGGISDGDGVEWAEVVDDAEGTSIPFYNAKPSRTVSGIGRFIHTRHYFVTDNFNELIVETWQDRDIFVDPRHMRNHRDADWGKKSCQNSPFSSSIHDKVGVTRYQHPYVSILLSGQMSDEKKFKHLLAEGRKGGILLS